MATTNARGTKALQSASSVLGDTSVSVTRWKCTNCGKTWTAGRAKKCPRCKAPDPENIGRAVSAVEAGRAHLNGTARDTVLSTTTPAGIRALDPDAIEAQKREAGRQTAEAAEEFLDGMAAPVPEIPNASVLSVPIDAVFPSPRNPRKTFDPASLKEVADSIAAHGVIQRLIVKPPVDGRYELIAGERRWRGAKLAKLKTVPIEVRDATDKEAVLLRLEENFRREGLNPIDQAQAFDEATRDGGYTQQELATSLHLTQGAVANKIRLLKLPEAARAKIISGEMSEKTAREVLLPWADVPGLLEKVVKECRKADLSADDVGNVLEEVADGFSRPMSENNWISGHRRFKPTAEQKKELRVRKFGRYGDERAFNVELWDRLQKAGIDGEEKREAARAKKKATEKVSPAEQKEKAKKQAGIFAKRLYGWKVRWLQRKIAERVSAEDQDELPLLKLLLHFAVTHTHTRRGEELADAVRASGGKKSGDGYYGIDDWKCLSTVAPAKLWDVAAVALGKWVLHDPSSYHCDFDPKEIEAFAGELSIDIKKEWKLDQTFLELHTSAQLLDLAEEWKIGGGPADKAKKRSELIKMLLSFGDTFKCPRELLDVKPVRLEAALPLWHLAEKLKAMNTAAAAQPGEIT